MTRSVYPAIFSSFQNVRESFHPINASLMYPRVLGLSLNFPSFPFSRFFMIVSASILCFSVPKVTSPRVARATTKVPTAPSVLYAVVDSFMDLISSGFPLFLTTFNFILSINSTVFPWSIASRPAFPHPVISRTIDTWTRRAFWKSA